MANRWKVLILDQHEDVLLNLEHALETAGFETTLAWHLDAFRRFAAECDFDLVLIGHRPPEIDAGEVLRALAPLRTQAIVLRGPALHPFEDDHFHRLGARAVLSRRDSDVATCIRDWVAGPDTIASGMGSRGRAACQAVSGRSFGIENM